MASFVASSPAASAHPAQDDTDRGVTLDLVAGLDGHVSPGLPFPVVVEITAGRLVSGLLQVSTDTDFGPSGVQIPVEVAASTTKRYVVTAAVASGFGGGQVRAAVRSDGRSVASADQTVIIDQSDELVGVLPGLVGSIDRTTVSLAVDSGLGRLGPLAPDVLAEGPVGLGMYDQIASGPGDLDDLSADDLATLTTWIGRGGHLLVDAVPGSPLPLPGALLPVGGSATAPAGLGRVTYTGGLLGGGRWDEVLLPTATQSQAEEQILSAGTGFIGDVTASLARDAGFRLPEIATVVLVLALYAVVVGPLAWVYCRRIRKPTRMWVVVPAVALLATLTLQLFGSDFRESEKAVHVTMVETSPGQTTGLATSSVFIASSTGGDATVALPHGWIASANPMFGFGGPGGLNPLVRSGDEAKLVVDTDQGGASVVRVTGPVAVDGGLVVTASSDTDGEVRGTVENTLDHDLRDVAVFMSRAGAVDVGSLAAGERKDWALDDATRFVPDAMPEATVWPIDVDPQVFGGAFFGPDGDPIDMKEPGAAGEAFASMSAFGDLLSARGSNFKPPGAAVAVGWTRSTDAPVQVEGEPVPSGRTGYVGRTAITPAGDRLADPVTNRQLVRGPEATAFGVGRIDANAQGVVGQQTTPTTMVIQGPVPAPVPAPAPGPGGFGGAAGGVFAFSLPDRIGDRPVDEARLRFHLPALFAAGEVWNGQGWVALPTVPAGGGEVDVPDGAVISGRIFVRVLIPTDRMPPPGREFVVYEVAQ